MVGLVSTYTESTINVSQYTISWKTKYELNKNNIPTYIIIFQTIPEPP